MDHICLPCNTSFRTPRGLGNHLRAFPRGTCRLGLSSTALWKRAQKRPAFVSDSSDSGGEPNRIEQQQLQQQEREQSPSVQDSLGCRESDHQQATDEEAGSIEDYFGRPQSGSPAPTS